MASSVGLHASGHSRAVNKVQILFDRSANHARGNWDAAFKARAAAWGASPNNPDQFRDFGFSTYNYHPDGSGVALSSRRRPVLSMRPGYLTFPDARGSGLRHLPADSHLTDWLEEKGNLAAVQV